MITEQEFLARRGDRALRLGYGACPADEVALIVRPDALQTPACVLAAITAANLLARWVLRLSVHLPNKTRSLATAIEEAVHTANPFLEIRWGPPRAGRPALAIGPGPGSMDEVTAWADGWVAVSTRGTATPGHMEPVTSVLLFAVTLGVGRVFRDAWRLASDSPTDFRWDTWRHNPESDAGRHERRPIPIGRPDLGHVLQVGAGAVGSNIIYFLGLMSASVDLVLLDHDVVKIENLDRSLLFGLEHASPHELAKVEAAVLATERFPSLRIHPERSKWAPYAENSYRVGDFDLALALANEDQVWPAMGQALLPLTLQATTDEDWGVALGVHAPGTGYCLRCRFPPNAQVLPTICSEGSIEIETTKGETEIVHASLPFQSAAAAALLAVEIEKLTIEPIEGAPNYIEAKIHQAEHVVTLRRPPSSACPTCRDFPEDLWIEKYGTSRFARHR